MMTDAIICGFWVSVFSIIPFRKSPLSDANISLTPHTADLGYITDGEHTLEIEISASRINTFGPLHVTDAFTNIWHGPNIWRTYGEEWSYDYYIKPAGILTSPELIEYC